MMRMKAIIMLMMIPHCTTSHLARTKVGMTIRTMVGMTMTNMPLKGHWSTMGRHTKHLPMEQEALTALDRLVLTGLAAPLLADLVAPLEDLTAPRFHLWQPTMTF
jgi:hypothetical protein